MVLEYVIGTSSTASALSQYIDSLTDGKISNAFNSTMPMNVGQFGPYPDWLAFSICIVVTSKLKAMTLFTRPVSHGVLSFGP